MMRSLSEPASMTSLPHTRHLRLRKSHLLLATALLAGPGLLHAQDVGPPVLPGKEPRPADLVAPARTAPPLQAPAPSTAPGPASPAAHLPRIKVREIRVTGSTVFSAQALDAITAP